MDSASSPVSTEDGASSSSSSSSPSSFNRSTPSQPPQRRRPGPKPALFKLDLPPRQFAPMRPIVCTSAVGSSPGANFSSSSSSSSSCGTDSSHLVSTPVTPQPFPQASTGSCRGDGAGGGGGGAAAAAAAHASFRQDEARAVQDDFDRASASLSAADSSTVSSVRHLPPHLREHSPRRQCFEAARVHPNIFLGNALDASDAATLVSLGITYVLNCARECDFTESVLSDVRIHKCHLDLRDNVDENIVRCLPRAFAFIDQAVHEGALILVHCFRGFSRAPSVTMAYIMSQMIVKDKQREQVSRRLVIEQHRLEDRRQTCSSPTLFDEMGPGSGQHSFPFADSSRRDALDFFSPSHALRATLDAAGRHDGAQDTRRATLGNATMYYYHTVLQSVQNVREDVLPNFSFSCALQDLEEKMLAVSVMV